jgi:hypothetical protein
MRVAARPAAPVREPRRRPEPADDDELVTWSEAPTSVVPAEPRAPRSEAPSDDLPAEPRAARDPADAPSQPRPRDPADAPSQPRPRDRADAPSLPRPRDRAVRREDAERIEVDDPPDVPLRPGEIPRAQDRGR